jgi:hypothetical protein
MLAGTLKLTPDEEDLVSNDAHSAARFARAHGGFTRCFAQMPASDWTRERAAAIVEAAQQRVQTGHFERDRKAATRGRHGKRRR